jgi:hypothetical protein
MFCDDHGDGIYQKADHGRRVDLIAFIAERLTDFFGDFLRVAHQSPHRRDHIGVTLAIRERQTDRLEHLALRISVGVERRLGLGRDAHANHDGRLLVGHTDFVISSGECG